MKHNPRLNERIASLPGFANVHPHQSAETVQGTLELLYGFKEYLCEILALDDATLQPAAGAHGEFTALKIFKAYHSSRGEQERDIIITTDSSHGTNPASAAEAGMKVVQIKSDENGNVDIDELKKAIAEHEGKIAGIMLTIPNTLGFFESKVPRIVELIHEAGGQVYMDGANLNAILGQVRPGDLGVDAVHVNLHKTFSTPHGGGGPGAGPVAVAGHLAKFLPKPTIEYKKGKYYLDNDRPASIGKVLANFGNVGVILKANAYRHTLGKEGLVKVSENAVLNANYLMAKITSSGFYDITHTPGSWSMHEFVLTPSEALLDKGVRTFDIAKALLDEGFHPPTVYFPLIVHEALMIEPTETASKRELDRFAG